MGDDRWSGTLTAATAELEAWWADKLPKISGGHKVQRGLNEQIQRLALDQSHIIAAKHKLSDADTKSLIAHALEHCEPPEVK